MITLAATALAQSANPIEYTPADARVKGYEQRLDMQESSLLKNVEFRSVGPTVMSARVTDLAVDPDDPTRFYVAYASGGVWKTTNNGQSFTPLFEGLASMTVGDIAAHWDSGTLYVGAGENNSSRSSYAGTGVYKTTDDGETWEWLGLAETHRAGRIVIHPDDPDVVWYAAAGHLYSGQPRARRL